jgi:NTP pyrophosphatase (non-canonical NTP hydrolase)
MPKRKRVFRGFFKLQEEMGELNQVMGKLGPFPDGKHPDGAKNLMKRLADEIADVRAAIDYFVGVNGIPVDDDRHKEKLKKFTKWGLTGIDPRP